MDKQRKIALHELEERLRSAQLHAKSYESKYSETTEQLQVLIRGINSIYNSPVCDKSLVIQALGNGTINESNVMQYLGSIEQVRSYILIFAIHLSVLIRLLFSIFFFPFLSLCVTSPFSFCLEQ